MSSDARVTTALSAVSARRAAYRATAIMSLERIRMVLGSAQGAERAQQQLGTVGALHIDAERFAELSHHQTMDASARAVITRASKFLREIVDAPESDFVLEIPERESLREVIENALSRWGRAFGVTAAAELARGNRYDRKQHDSLLEPWPFARWTRTQRLSGPPVVAVVAGSDLRAGDLAGLLDGAAHIVLVVTGDCSPAALVRLITPATLVVQTSDEKGLDRFKAYAGPAIAALVPDSAATFIHDPANGAELWQRLTIWRRPEKLPNKSVGGSSVTLQQQELQQLYALATPPSLPIAAVDALAPPGAWNGNATDRLASWLLAQAGDGKPA